MARLTRDQIIELPTRTEVVEVPEWGGDIEIRELSLAQVEAIEKPRSNVDAGLKVFLEGVIDPQFQPSDYETLKKRGHAAMMRVLARIMSISGMDADSQAEILGKSKTTPR